MNMVPREGGNTFAGNLYLSGANEGDAGQQRHRRARARGLTHAAGLRSVWDYEGLFGGPVMRDGSGSWARCATTGSTTGRRGCTTTGTRATRPSGPTSRT